MAINLHFNLWLMPACAIFATASSALPDHNPRQITTTGQHLNQHHTRADFGRVSLIAAAIAQEFSLACPLADAADQLALTTCKTKLYGASALRRYLPDYVLWGRMRNQTTTLNDTSLTQFGRDVFTAIYMPLFMFNGDYTVNFDEREKLYRIEFVTAFRNRLPPGQFPYPFWHDDNKWATYQGANQITMWVGLEDSKDNAQNNAQNKTQNNAGTEQIKAIQFSTFGRNHQGVPEPIAKPEFSTEQKKWLWTDAAGKTQPTVTLFDNLYSANNPNLNKLEATYRAVALEMRNAECLSCHVPNNPDHSKRLVLLQTPAHAAAEISRVIKSVKQGRMPLDDIGLAADMPDKLKTDLLGKAEAFAAAVQDARAWEATATK